MRRAPVVGLLPAISPMPLTYVFCNVPLPVRDSSLSRSQPSPQLYHVLTLLTVRCRRFWFAGP
jgi:hypothetical protein